MLLPSPRSRPQPPADARRPAVAAPRRKRGRSGATAMDYLVCATFILVLLIAGVQHLASVTQGLLQKDANPTKVLPGPTGR